MPASAARSGTRGRPGFSLSQWGDRLAQRLFANVAAKDIADIGDVFSVVAIGDAFEAGVCTESV